MAAAACWRSCTSSHRHHRSALSFLKARPHDPPYPLVLRLLIVPFRPFRPVVPRRSSAFLLLLLRQPSPLLSSHRRFRWWLGRIARACDTGGIAVAAAIVALVYVEPWSHRAQRTRSLISAAISCLEFLCQHKVNTSIYALAQLEIDALFTGCCHCFGPASWAVLKSSYVVIVSNIIAASSVTSTDACHQRPRIAAGISSRNHTRAPQPHCN